jgi:hypothetical protein
MVWLVAPPLATTGPAFERRLGSFSIRRVASRRMSSMFVVALSPTDL